ncbi:hypothetical protein M413DRAFT_437786 [Hebeloma cylindrosporum]|uniref:Uncharacterized protein n=1 Tax=Hebeloma cylindrosporum TaxID=76867 RepID=A0A0C3CIL6_HEBCY|nr:hypothetical protein M413DRAFT_437786 [Hebeloma cylindrosporum h7]
MVSTSGGRQVKNLGIVKRGWGSRFLHGFRFWGGVRVYAQNIDQSGSEQSTHVRPRKSNSDGLETGYVSGLLRGRKNAMMRKDTMMEMKNCKSPPLEC